MSNKKISIYDTTLRDGAQTVGISFSLHDKLLIAGALDRLNIDYIEGGWPGSNPKDDQFFQEIRKVKLEHSKIVAFGSTKRKNNSCRSDKLLQALLASRAKIFTIVAKSWDFHVTHALNISLNDNLKLMYDTIAYLKDKGMRVFLDAEHFFDGFKSNEEYTHRFMKKACDAGADMIVFCDTNGGTMPHEVERIIEKARLHTAVPIGVHFHNDAGVAVAN
jgi:2-isopropylmalate synthase